MHRILFALTCLLGLFSLPAWADEPVIVRQIISPSDFPRAREALQDAIENQGLIAGATSHFGEMLARTGPSLGRPVAFYDQAEVVSFCSATVSWGLVEEQAAYIALCPLTIAIYTLPGEKGTVYLSYRDPGSASPALRRAAALLRDIASATLISARRHTALE
jgi:uncharacterized protein (DUF302 family)